MREVLTRQEACRVASRGSQVQRFEGIKLLKDKYNILGSGIFVNEVDEKIHPFLVVILLGLNKGSYFISRVLTVFLGFVDLFSQTAVFLNEICTAAEAIGLQHSSQVCRLPIHLIA
jgi:hypothetical protein